VNWKESDCEKGSENLWENSREKGSENAPLKTNSLLETSHMSHMKAAGSFEKWGVKIFTKNSPSPFPVPS